MQQGTRQPQPHYTPQRSHAATRTTRTRARCPDRAHHSRAGVQGELFEFIEGRGPLEEPLARRITYQLLCGLQYLHSKGIVHRDMKPENVLLHLAPQPAPSPTKRHTRSPARLAPEDQRIQAKIADFGLAKVMDEKPGAALGTFCGTASYLAPEIFKGRGGSVKRYGPKVRERHSHCTVTLQHALTARTTTHSNPAGRRSTCGPWGWCSTCA